MDDFSRYLSNSTITDVTRCNHNTSVAILPTRDDDIETSDNTEELEDSMKKDYVEMKDGGIRDAIAVFHFKKKQSLLERIEELTKRIEEKYSVYKLSAAQSAKPTYFARDLRFEDGFSNLETSCMKAVRELCELISGHFQKEYSSEEVGICEQEKRNVILSKEEIWSKVEELGRGFGADEVSRTILQSIVATTESLKELTSKVDLEDDAGNLKFKFEAGKLRDVSSTPGILKTVRQLIEIGQIAHFQRFVACEKSSNETHNLKAKLQKLNTEISNVLKSRFEPAKAQLMQRYFMGCQEKAAVAAQTKHLEEEIIALRSEKQEQEANAAQIMQNYNKIQNFDKTVQEKQLMIQKIIQVNGSAKSTHRKQHKHILTMINEKVVKKKQEITDLCHQYQEVTSNEFASFLKLPSKNLCSFKNSSDECQLVRDLGIHRFDGHQSNPGMNSLKYALKKLELPKYSAPETFTSHIRDMRETAYGDVKNSTFSDKIGNELAEINFKIASLKGSLHKLHRGLENTLVPCLKEAKDNTSQIIVECVKFGDCSQAWWQQMGQYTVPWVTVDGFNTHQYVEQFSTQAELLKKMRDV